MKCIFVGDLEDDAGFVAEVLQEKGIELIEAGVYDQIEKTINPVIEAQAEIVVYDLLVLSDQRMNWLILSIESNNPETVQKLFSWQLEKEPTHQLLISC